jgi:hypothetical protein
MNMTGDEKANMLKTLDDQISVLWKNIEENAGGPDD